MVYCVRVFYLPSQNAVTPFCLTFRPPLLLMRASLPVIAGLFVSTCLLHALAVAQTTTTAADVASYYDVTDYYLDYLSTTSSGTRPRARSDGWDYGGLLGSSSLSFSTWLYRFTSPCFGGYTYTTGSSCEASGAINRAISTSKLTTVMSALRVTLPQSFPLGLKVAFSVTPQTGCTSTKPARARLYIRSGSSSSIAYSAFVSSQTTPCGS